MTGIRGLYAVIDTTYVPFDGIGQAARAIISGNARILQLRAKELPSGRMLAAARLLRGITLESGVTFIVNDRVDVAMMSRADGVHLGQDDIPLAGARALLGKGAIIGVSTHNPAEAAQAQKSGADYISFGPIFPTKTKKDAHSPQGLSRLRELHKMSALPIVAIGGITAENVAGIFSHGAASAAIVSGILTATDMKGKTAEIAARIEACMGHR
ncbi:MAG: thiamine phosphate synthase [Deltaproteobacteria bacterium]|nr:thiamine phosphate synthase [Deltaproteobacteria bacterium]